MVFFGLSFKVECQIHMAMSQTFTHPWLILKSQSNLVGGFNHLEKYGSQLGWWHPIYEMENNPVMFETTNQQLVKKNSLTVGSVWDHQDLELDPHHFLDLRHDPCLASSCSVLVIAVCYEKLSPLIKATMTLLNWNPPLSRKKPPLSWIHYHPVIKPPKCFPKESMTRWHKGQARLQVRPSYELP